MSPARQSRHALEEVWRRRMLHARAQWEAVCERTGQVLRAVDGNSGTIDGQHAIHEASHLEHTALAEYRRCLDIFAALVVHGTEPPPD